MARSGVTVSAYLTEWVAGRRDLRGSTQRHYASNVRPFVDKFGDLSLQALTKRHLDDWIRERVALGRSARTIRLSLGVLSQALDAAVKESLIVANPVRLVVPPRPAPVVKPSAWDASQCKQFLAVASETRESALWRLAMLGLRRGETLGARWSDVDLDAGTLHVVQSRVLEGGTVVVNPPKTKRGRRVVPLPDGVLADLRRFRTTQQRERLALGQPWDDDGLVATDVAGRGIRPEAFTRDFQRLTKAAGLPLIRLHDARHSAASLMASLGVEPVVAASVSGARRRRVSSDLRARFRSRQEASNGRTRPGARRLSVSVCVNRVSPGPETDSTEPRPQGVCAGGRVFVEARPERFELPTF